jgi:hypothetical protein
LVAARSETPFQPPLAMIMGELVYPFTDGAVEAELGFLPFSAPLAAAVVPGVPAWATWTTATPVMGADAPRAGEADPEDDPVEPAPGAAPPPAVGGAVGGTVGGTVGVVEGTVVGAVVVDRGGCVVGVVLGTVVGGTVLAGRVIGEAIAGRLALCTDDVRWVGLLGGHGLPRPSRPGSSARALTCVLGDWWESLGNLPGDLEDSSGRELGGLGLSDECRVT